MSHSVSYVLRSVTFLSIVGSALVLSNDIRPISDTTQMPSNNDDSGTGCPPEQCGMNGTVMSALQLRADGQPNSHGISVDGFVDARGFRSSLAIEDGRLVGLDPDTGNAVVRDSDLLGGHIALRRDDMSAASRGWALTVREIVVEPYMSNQPGVITGYRFDYGPMSNPSASRPLCADGGPAVLVSGERYDARTLHIDDAHAQPGRSWFSLACRDHVLAKIRKMSYAVESASDERYAVDVRQRRATLAMLTADYCGDGRRFTTPGTPLYWQNRDNRMVVGAEPPASAPVEAGWSEHGATCLNTPRQRHQYTHADIEHACGRSIPTCTTDVLAASEWTTWLP